MWPLPTAFSELQLVQLAVRPSIRRPWRKERERLPCLECSLLQGQYHPKDFFRNPTFSLLKNMERSITT